MAIELDGPGRVEIVRKAARGEPAETTLVRLWNFDTDHAELKTRHKDELFRLLPLMLRRQNPVRVFLRGLASRLGNRRYNHALAKRRVSEVMRFLIQSGVRANRIGEFDFPGEDVSSDVDGGNDAFDRAVELQITENLVPDRNLRLPRRPRPNLREPVALRRQPISREFAIRLEIGVSVSLNPVAGVSGMTFVIWDTSENMLIASYLFGAGTRGLPTQPLPDLPIDAAVVGPWNCFSTVLPTSVGGFSGTAQFGELTLGPPGRGLERVEFTMTPFFGPRILIREFEIGLATPNTPALLDVSERLGIMLLFPGSTRTFSDDPRILLHSRLGHSCINRRRRLGRFAS
jgi:hypothetical protein